MNKSAFTFLFSATVMTLKKAIFSRIRNHPILRIKCFLVVLGILTGAYITAHGQNFLAAKPAELQLVGVKINGEAAMAQSDALTITYRPKGIYVDGVLAVASISSKDPEVIDLLSRITATEITFETTIPPDQFTFGEQMEVTFTSPATLLAGNMSIEFTIDFTVSHQRTGETNTFLITGAGELSLEALDLSEETVNLKDRIAFQFRQTVRTSKV